MSELESKIKTIIKTSTDADDWIRNFSPKAKVNYNVIKKKCIADGNSQKCCRHMNYYLDYITALINLSHLDRDRKDEAIYGLDDFWDKHLSSLDYTCHRSKNTESIIERYILKELHDFHEDIDYLVSVLNHKFRDYSEYNMYIKKKWEKIFEYAKHTVENKNIVISNGSINKIIHFKELPLNYNLLSSLNLNTGESRNITITFELSKKPHQLENLSINSASRRETSHVNTDVEDISIRKIYHATNIFPIKNFLILFFIIFLIIVISMVLYKITPLGIWIRDNIKMIKFLQKQIIRNRKEALSSKAYNDRYKIEYSSYISGYNNDI
ncbi:hypothetical protein PGO_021700 [Plasmodium gonderi]|uniref:Variable surface protein n=1 Tax=Plasmodium gonderi TaxID=77519 RepID=A0A1Y1JDA1_PLAGO|nr:hypothetical protein PGO_021700 [Plasmodium gonderi]GAW79197.1 hypothetical protein PGO_021700 [Plasmodium gonderi]